MEESSRFEWWRVVGGSLAIRGGNLKREGKLTADSYSPLDDPTLYRRFADLPLDDDAAYVEFANDHGLLTLSLFEIGSGEQVALWREQVYQMRLLTQLHDLLGTRMLEKFVQPRLKEGVFRVLAPFDTSRYIETGVRPQDAKHFKNASSRAQYVIASIAHRTSTEYPIYRLPVWTTSEQRFRRYSVPSSLLAGLWDQALSSMSGEALPTLRCETCGTWMQAERDHAAYCSPACRQKAYRKRLKAEKKR